MVALDVGRLVSMLMTAAAGTNPVVLVAEMEVASASGDPFCRCFEVEADEMLWPAPQAAEG